MGRSRLSAPNDAPRGSARRQGRVPTTTARFGSGRRESHDASPFYERFVAPEISTDATVEVATDVDVIHLGDSRSMDAVPDNAVGLVVTSPPYFAGKEYEAVLGEGGVPADYFEYLELLRGVFAECARVLEPGGRIAVNVANLGRRPYRSLSGDVTQILADLGLLLRGEVIWWKGRAAGGSCAWGTFQRPANPVLRDVTERIVIASKGRFDRALSPTEREARGLPSVATVSREEFMAATTDMWEIAPERARRVGHPAPFPVELPQRLIELFTYRHDVVLDPFAGSGSTAVAALRSGRHYIGYDNEAIYVESARERIAAERVRLEENDGPGRHDSPGVELPARPVASGANDELSRAVREGRKAKELAGVLLEQCGFTDIDIDVKPRGLGIQLDFTAVDQAGGRWAFDVSGALITPRSGLKRADEMWKAIGTASVLAESDLPHRLVLLTTDTPAPGTSGGRALAAVRGPARPVYDIVEILTPEDQERLAHLARHGVEG